MVGCAPSENAIQTAIAETQAAIPTNTMAPPTVTPLPTNTPIVMKINNKTVEIT